MFLKALQEADKQKMMETYEDLVNHVFNFFQRLSKHPLKEIKASGGCHGNRKGVLCASTKPIPDAIMLRHN